MTSIHTLSTIRSVQNHRAHIVKLQRTEAMQTADHKAKGNCCTFCNHSHRPKFITQCALKGMKSVNPFAVCHRFIERESNT